MAPPSATHTSETVETGASVPTHGKDEAGNATHEPGLTKKQAAVQEGAIKFPGPKQFQDKYEEREYQKGRLALAFRIFAKLDFDEGVAGHITLRVCCQHFVSGDRRLYFLILGPCENAN
jgi:hypothetical protein